jgi:hypothetical protein
MKITAGSGSINVNSSSVSPTPYIAKANVICHLTQGFNPAVTPGNYNQAWDAPGSFRIVVGPNDDLTQWSFGYVQFQKMNDTTLIYGGFDPSFGGITVNISAAPAMTQKVALDSGPHNHPWTKLRVSTPQTGTPAPRFQISLGLVTTTTGDHPTIAAGRFLPNNITGVPNFLFRVIDEREFWTVLAAMDSGGNMQYAAYFHWKIRYDMKFKWRSNANDPILTSSTSITKFDSPVQGAPQDAALQTLLKNPTTPYANDLMTAAITTALNSTSLPNRLDTPRRDASIPGDFFL